jgi:hypothetical protein
MRVIRKRSWLLFGLKHWILWYSKGLYLRLDKLYNVLLKGILYGLSKRSRLLIKPIKLVSMYARIFHYLKVSKKVIQTTPARKPVLYLQWHLIIWFQSLSMYLVGVAKCTTGVIRRVTAWGWSTTCPTSSPSSGSATVEPLTAVSS